MKKDIFNPMRIKGLPDWCGPGLIALLFLCLTVGSWRKWCDALIDFGRELYVPWQIMEGKVLYRDIAYLNGPLSPYANALWFRLFGVSLSTLIFCNLAILAIITMLIYALVKRSCGRFTATITCIAFLTLFGFSHTLIIGNYNYVLPYSHEMTHGILLSFLMIFFISRCISSQGYGWLAPAGLCLGMVFLGKPEIFSAALPAAILGLVLVSRRRRAKKAVIPLALTFSSAALVPIILFWAYLYAHMPLDESLKAICGAWPAVLCSNISHTVYYKFVSGFDRPSQNLLLMLRKFLGTLMLAGSFICVGLVFSRTWTSEARKALVSALAIILLLSAVWFKRSIPVVFDNSMPLVVLIAGTAVMTMLRREWNSREAVERLAPLAMLAVFGTALLAKMVLHARIAHYGFVLAMPAALVIVAVFAGLIPERLNASAKRGSILRWTTIVMISLDIGLVLTKSFFVYSKMDLRLGNGADSFFAYGPKTFTCPEDLKWPKPFEQFYIRDYAVAKLLKFIESSTPPSATLAVLPEGVTINYLTRRPNPTPYINFMPPEMMIFGSGRILRAFEDHPPDYVVLIHSYKEEYGVSYFGLEADYGKSIMDWVKGHYMPVWGIYAEPLRDKRFGIRVLRRRTAGPAEVIGAAPAAAGQNARMRPGK